MTMNETIGDYLTPEAEILPQIRSPPPTEIVTPAKASLTVAHNTD